MPTLQVTRRESFNEGKFDPENDFDKIIQQANGYLDEAKGTVMRFRTCNSADVDILDCQTQVEKTLEQVAKIAKMLENYIDEKTVRRDTDGVISPRVLSSVKSSKTLLDELWRGVKDVKKSMQSASLIRDRKELFNDWDKFNNSTPRRRQRDAEEITSDATERLLNSKRILLESVQASSGTLTSLATSSQSIDKNDQELQNQHDIVGTARTLLKKYGRRASTDKLLIWIGFIFFGFCAMIVAYRRLL